MKIYKDSDSIIIDDGNVKYSVSRSSIDFKEDVNGKIRTTVDLLGYSNFSKVMNISDILDENGSPYGGTLSSILEALQIDTSTGVGTTSGSNVNIAQEGNDIGFDAWGRPKTITDYTLFSGLWTFQVNNRQWQYNRATNDGNLNFVEQSGIPKDNSLKYVKSKNGYLSVISDGTYDTLLNTHRHLRYQPNKGYLYSSAHIFPNPIQKGVREIGLDNRQSGVFFRLVGDDTTWKMYAVKVTTIQGTTTEDAVDITQDVLNVFPTFDPSKGHVYDIQMQWRGVGNFFFYIDLKKVYTKEMLGTLTAMSVNNPALQIGYACYGADSDLEIITGCVDITSEGGHKSNKVRVSINTGDDMLNVSRNSWDGTAVLAVRLPDTILYDGNQVKYTRDLSISRLITFCKDESITGVWNARLVNSTNLNAIATNSDPTLGWAQQADSFFEYMIGGDSSVLDSAFKSDKTAGNISNFLRVRQEKDFQLAIKPPAPEETQEILTAGTVLVITMTPDGTSQKGGASLEFAEEI